MPATAIEAVADVAAAAAAVRRDGLCVLRGIIPADEVDAVRSSVTAAVHEHSRTEPPKGYVPGFLRADTSIAPYIANERMLGAARELLRGDYLKIAMLTGIVNGPGIERGVMHADWPYNQRHQSRIVAPYPDLLTNLVTMWMLTEYRADNGGTLVIPGSHLRPDSPRPGGDFDPNASYPDEIHLTGSAGDVALFDARTWHAVAPNVSGEERVGVLVRYCPWWLNLNPLRPGHVERRYIVEAHDGTDSQVDLLPAAVYGQLPADVQPLVYHMVDGEVGTVGEVPLAAPSPA